VLHEVEYAVTKNGNKLEQPAESASKLERTIAEGKTVIAGGKPKIAAAMTIYAALLGEPQEVVVNAFIEGAALTPKGAVTYWYNCRRKHNRLKSAMSE
jgi:hypothetical protein